MIHKALIGLTTNQSMGGYISYPSSPGFGGWYTFFNPNNFAAEAVVSPMQATALFHFSDSGIRLTHALHQQEPEIMTKILLYIKRYIKADNIHDMMPRRKLIFIL